MFWLELKRVCLLKESSRPLLVAGKQDNLIVKHEREEEVTRLEHVGWKLTSCVTDRCGELSHQLEEQKEEVEEDKRVEEEDSRDSWRRR